jgi:hypothetical protein
MQALSDPRNRRHQRYCSATACRAASKAASQARLARRTREPRLLPRPGERHPGPGVAAAPSRVLVQGSTCRRCVTRVLKARYLGSTISRTFTFSTRRAGSSGGAASRGAGTERKDQTGRSAGAPVPSRFFSADCVDFATVVDGAIVVSGYQLKGEENNPTGHRINRIICIGM